LRFKVLRPKTGLGGKYFCFDVLGSFRGDLKMTPLSKEVAILKCRLPIDAASVYLACHWVCQKNDAPTNIGSV